ncbi:MAG: hybrid sensor histidine kinase/response regulator [Cytophagales bacterium]
MKSTLLYVDDEEKNLTSFRAVFRKDYEILLAKSAEEGYNVLKENNVQIVVSDQRMPNETGVEFLEKISSEYPDVIRIILTGYSDYDAILDSINKAKVYKFVPKPWKKEEFKDLLDKAFELYNLRLHNHILSRNILEINQELDRFIYSAAHDLRAPILTLKGLNNLSKEETDLKALNEMFKMKDKTLSKLEQFIGEINQYSRNIRSNVEFEKVCLKEIVNTCINDLENEEGFNRAIFHLNIEETSFLFSDKSRVYYIFQNILSNSVKFYNPEIETNDIDINITITPISAQIIIQDSGIGIEQEIINNVFDMFFKGINQNAGSGLGLFITKQSVKRLKGIINLESEINKGTKISITLPNNIQSNN